MILLKREDFASFVLCKEYIFCGISTLLREREGGGNVCVCRGRLKKGDGCRGGFTSKRWNKKRGKR